MLSREESRSTQHASYNNGAVWPFTTGFAALALYANGRDEAGFAYLDGMKALTLLGDRGYVPELLSGDRATAVDAAVPHQLFATAGFVSTLLRGLLGLTHEGLAPSIPAGWDFLRVRNLHWRDGVYDFEWMRDEGGSLTARRAASGFAPSVRVPDDGGVRLRPDHAALAEGDESARLRVVETRRDGRTVTVRLEGRRNRAYRLILDTDLEVVSVENGRQVEGAIEVRFPDAPTPWLARELVLELGAER